MGSISAFYPAQAGQKRYRGIRYSPKYKVWGLRFGAWNLKFGAWVLGTWVLRIIRYTFYPINIKNIDIMDRHVCI